MWAPSLVGSNHLFIGHAVCPGFQKIAAQVPWWQDTPFCAPGFDYFHDGLDYAQVPVDLAPHAYVAVSVADMEAAAWAEPAQRAVLLYPDPVDQAAFYFKYCQTHSRPSHNKLILPHPGIPERIFVLKPIAEMATKWRHPLTHLTAQAMLRRLRGFAQGQEI